jgi:hypothetical protein
MVGEFKYGWSLIEFQFSRYIDGENVEARKKIYCYRKVACVGMGLANRGFNTNTW